MINTAGVLKETGTAHPSRAPGFTPVFGGVHVAFHYSCLYNVFVILFYVVSCCLCI